jgi:hypothetical protein
MHAQITLTSFILEYSVIFPLLESITTDPFVYVSHDQC